jgi:3-dehydroquinate synthase
VRSSSGTYGVHLGPGGFASALSRGGDVVVVDAGLRHLVPPRDLPVLDVEASEAGKTLAGCERLIVGLIEAGVRRGDHLLAVGGGAVQDIVTFVADVYMRGLAWTYVPTTLMSMADSCIGGKSAINVGTVKNLVGGIHPPDSVIIDPAFLGSLSPSALAAGLSEAAKIAYCRGPEAFEGYLERYDRFEADPTALIEHVLRAKTWFIEIDEHDVKERRLLNFGHTFGHALETAVDHTLSHGLAVATGMLCAIRHPASGAGPQVEALESHCRALLACVPDLADSLARFDAERFELAFRSDKKHGSSTFRLILPTAHGGVAEVERDSSAAEWALVEKATRTTLDSLTGETP